MSVDDELAPSWVGVVGITAALGLAAVVGFALGLIYCESRRVSEFQQLALVAHSVTSIGEQCVSSLTDITKAAIVLARNEHEIVPKPRTVVTGTILDKGRPDPR